MTVSAANPPFNEYTAAPGAVVFPYKFKVIKSDDIKVLVNGVVKALGTDYTLSGIGANDGGNVTFLTPMAGGENVVARMDLAFDRDTDYQQNGDFLSPTVNGDYDRLWLALQQVGQSLKAAIKLPFTTTAEQSITQSAGERANTVLAFDASGNLTTSTTDAQNVIAAQAAAAAAQAAAASIDPNNLVHRTGNETIGGTKTFATRPIVGTAAGVTNDTAAASTEFANNAAASAAATAVTAAANSAIRVRQCVQYGPRTTPSAGNPAQADLIPQSQIGNTLATSVIMKCSTAPTLFSVANGFASDGSPVNLNYRATADIQVPPLAGSATNYIWFDTVSLAVGSVTVADNEQSGGTIPVTNNQYTYDRIAQKMYLGNGTTAVQVNRLIVAEVDTSGSAVAAIRVRPYLAAFEGSWVTPLAGAGITIAQSHNMGSTQGLGGHIELLCLAADGGFAVGTVVRGATGTNSNGPIPSNQSLTRNTIFHVTGGATAWILTGPGSGGTVVTLNAASWAYRFVCSRQNR